MTAPVAGANGDVSVEVHDGGWRVTWPHAGISARYRTDRGAWTAARGDASARAGTWLDGPSIRVHVPDDGPVVTVEASAVRDGRVVVLDGVVDLDPASSVRLVNGYQSWDYAGVRRGDEPGHTWWGGALAQPGGVGLAFHAATSRRLATSVRTEPDGDTLRMVALAAGSPELTPVPPSWSFRASEATPLDLSRSGAGPVEPEPFLLAADPDPLRAMEVVATAVAGSAGARRWDGPPMLGWESWYHFGFSITPDAVMANARLMRERFPDRFRVVQIDDGWQRSYGDWRPTDGWPGDLSTLTAELRDLGCFPGLWLAPFMTWPGGPGMGQRTDLLLGDTDDDGPKIDALMGRNTVDASHPEALQWLHDLGAQVRRWGFRMVKLDFLYLGAQEGRRHDPSMTGTEALVTGLDAFVDGLGDDVYVLGCGMPMLPAVGLCHANRVGGDLAAPIEWPFPDLTPFDPAEGWLGIHPQARNVAARWWTHGRLFHNDPEVVMAAGPPEGPPYSVEEARVQAVAAALAGGPFLLADDLAALAPEKRSVVEDGEILDVAWGVGFRPVDLFETADEADPDFFTRPTAVPTRWVAEREGRQIEARFDWSARRVTL